MAPPPPRRLPAELEALQAELHSWHRARQFDRLVDGYARLLDRLRALWGPASPDLASYVYNYALALKLAGRPQEFLRSAADAAARWPENVPLRVLLGTSLAERAIAARVPDPRAESLLRELLRTENIPRLRGYRVSPAKLHLQWAMVLFFARRETAALEAVEAGLRVDADDPPLQRLKSRLLFSAGRYEDALPLLRRFASQEDPGRLAFLLARSLFLTGDAAAASPVYARLLGRLDAEPAMEGVAPAELRVHAARCLLELDRPWDAVPLLEVVLLETPDHYDALVEFARALRVLDADDAARALTARVRALEEVRALERQEEGARARGLHANAHFYAALADLLVGRTADALDELTGAIRLSPQRAEFHLERARVLAVIGDTTRAQALLERAWQESQEPLFLLDRARWLASSGAPDEARRLLARVDGAPHDAAQEGRAAVYGEPRATISRCRTVRAYLALGDVEASIRLGQTVLRDEKNADEVLLCRAELALLEGRLELARAILFGRFPNSPGGDGWANAMRVFLAVRLGEAPGPTRDDDRSDLVDHPRLFRTQRYLGDAGAAAAHGAGADVPDWLAELRALDDRRSALLAPVAGREPAQAVDAWRTLLRFYLSSGLRRKAREVGWLLVSLDPTPADYGLLAAALDAPEEAVVRLALLERACARFPGDPPLAAQRRETRAFLRLADL